MNSILITGGRLVDGTGNPWRQGDLLIRGDRIEAITRPGQVQASSVDEVIEAKGKIVSPGFIDIMSHSIRSLMCDGRCLSKLTQGVTTEIMGEFWTPAPVGGRFRNIFSRDMFREYWKQANPWEERAKGWSRFSDWLEAIEAEGSSVNVGSLLGGGTLRCYGRGMDAGPSSREERELMKEVMRQAMEDGAFGVAYALIYPPDCFVDTEELIEICKVVAEYGGIYATHMRSESNQILKALEETIEITRASKVRTEIYHLKAQGSRNWDKMDEVIRRIERARAEGLDITADMYPYPASGTGLTAMLPNWLAEGGRFFENLENPEIRKKVFNEILEAEESNPNYDRFADPSSILPIAFTKPENLIYFGKRLEEIAQMRNEHWIDTIFHLLRTEQQRIFTLYFNIHEENLQKQLQLPWIKIASDAPGVAPEWADKPGTAVHPRSYGTFPRVLGHYSRDQKLFPLEEAVRKMTSFPANQLGLKDRGRLEEGYYADVVIFDQEKIRDHSIPTKSHQFSEGIEEVWVNGQHALRQGKVTDARAGKFLKGPGAKPS